MATLRPSISAGTPSISPSVIIRARSCSTRSGIMPKLEPKRAFPHIVLLLYLVIGPETRRCGCASAMQSHAQLRTRRSSYLSVSGWEADRAAIAEVSLLPLLPSRPSHPLPLSRTMSASLLARNALRRSAAMRGPMPAQMVQKRGIREFGQLVVGMLGKWMADDVAVYRHREHCVSWKNRMQRLRQPY